ncbi:phosphotriesterase [Aeromicrobium sp. CF4.19]|uniref:phosphotriesterase family protein n=1 Tax=Aeromicrobium sp. CF4.19 TaxID=3373082 RepID=UPI003EE6B358
MIQTVLGPTVADDLGFTLPHEHVFINLMPEYRGDGLLNDPDLMVHELEAFRRAGGASIVETTSSGLGRDPEALKAISERSGVSIVMGSGYYRDPYLPDDQIDRTSSDGLSELIVHDIEIGAEGTGVRAGIIGEVGCDKSYISAREERCLRAAARAQRRTGLAITTHAARWPVGHAQLDIFEEEGVDLRRVIVGHCDSVPDPAYHLALADRGAYVQFDMLGIYTSEYEQAKRARFVLNLVEAGFHDRILLSHDVCLRSALTANGGVGYSHIATSFLPRLRAAGVSEDLIEEFTVHNVARGIDQQ